MIIIIINNNNNKNNNNGDDKNNNNVIIKPIKITEIIKLFVITFLVTEELSQRNK